MKNRSLQLKRVAFALFVLLLSVAGVKTTNAQSTLGTDFWVTFLPNWDGNINLSLIAAGSAPCSGTITNPYTNWSTEFEVSVGATTIIDIPLSEAYSHNISDYVVNTALHVVTTDSISLFASNFMEYSFDVTDVLPTYSLGSNYIIQTYPGVEIAGRGTLVSPSNHTKGLAESYSEFTIVAVEDNTTVYITLTDNSLNGHYANQPFSVTLNAGQCYQVMSVESGNLSGSQISVSGNKKVAVFAGNSCANVPSDCSACDHIVEQMMPVSCWGNHFVVTNSSTRNYDEVRVTAMNNNCQIFINGSYVTTINQKQSYQFEITSDNPSLYLETSEQAMVYLYISGGNCGGSNGDPSMVMISPIEQRMDYVTFGTFNSGASQNHFVNVITTTDDASSVQLDGNSIAPEFQTVSGNSDYSFARVAIEHGSHTLSTTGEGFVAHVYGLGEWESYAYSVGSNAIQELYTNMLVNGQTALDDMDVCGQTVNFDLNYNYNVSQVNWNFGDGQTGSGIPITHEYPDLGDYAVSCDVYKLDSYGQDSLVTTLSTVLHIYDTSESEFNITSYGSYSWMGHTYTHSGNYVYEGQTVHGCDSIVTLHLTIATLQVIAEYFPDVNDPNSPYVRVHWAEATEAQIGEGTSTTGYFPFYTYYDYSLAESLYLASELEAAGVTSAPMSSLSWYATNAPGYAQEGISIWMANVSDTELTTTSHIVDGMTLVYTGAMTPEVGWNEFVFNEGSFTWDGYSNVLILCQRNNGSWNNGVYWQADDVGFNAMAYSYRDYNAYDVTIPNTMNTSTTRPNIIIKSVGDCTENLTYNLYRANCDGSGLQMIADNLSENQYIDTEWPGIAPGIYKYGVSVVEERGNVSEVSEIHWNNTPVNLNHHTLDASAFLNPVTNNRNHKEPSRMNYDNGWLYYDDGTLQSSVGASGSIYWGMMIPAANLTPYAGTSLTKVAVMEYQTGGSYTANIYLGGSDGPGTLVATKNFSVTGTLDWKEVDLDTPVAIDGTQNLWITMYQAGISYPATVCNNTGDANGRWVSTDGNSWYDLMDIAPSLTYTWMIRGYIDSGASEIFWSNCIDKDMYLGEGEVNVTVLLNSGDSPAGTTVSFTNLDSNEQELYPVADITLDGSGYYAWDNFRKGDYQVTITKEGCTTITETVGIWEATSLSYVLEEITQSPTRLYVSSTGWAKWDGLGEPLTPVGAENSFSVDFESGMPADWTTIDADGDGYNWMLASTAIGTGYGHNGSSDMIMSQSYDNTYGALNPDNYLVSPQVTLSAGSTFSFWACAQDASWAAEHFGVAVSDNGTSDWTMVQEWTMTAKGEGGKVGRSRNGGNRAQGNWYQYIVDLSAFAGQKYIAIRHFNCSDWFYLDVDDITLTNGAKDGDRHYMYNQVVLTNAQGNVLYTENTTNKYCQLPVGNLIEGETYHCKVASVYSSGLTEWAETDWVYQSCDNYEGANDLFATTTEEGNLVSWTYPEMGRNNTRGSLAYSCRNNSDWVSYYTDDPFNATYLNSISLYGGDYCPLDGYVYATYGGYAYKIEPQTGTVLEEEYIDYSFYDCAWDYTTNTMYAVRDQDFYIWNLENNTVEYIGSADPSFEVLACDLNGELYGIAVGYPAALYKIDKTNASLELVGYTGQNCDYYWQSGNIDHTNGKLYWTNTTDGTLVEVDIETGESTVLNTDIGQNTSFCIPYDGVLYVLGAMVYRDNELVGFTSDNSYLDLGETANHQYDIRLVYGGPASCPDNNIYYSMSCPQTASDDEGYHWSVNIYEYPYNMSVTGIIQINGVEQQTAALEIGAFCGDECRGTQRLTYYPQVDRYLVFLTLYGDAGDVMNFRLYNHALGQELDLSCSSTISFVPDGFMGTPFDPYVFDFGGMTVEQVSNFSQGYNWWSTCIEQEGINGLAMLQEGLGSNGVTIRSQASGYTDYYQGYGWYGSLSSINNESSYRIITSAPCTVTMTGSAAVPSQHPITLSQGWTWIGYVPSTTMSVDAAMMGVNAVQGDKLKSQQGYADYYPGYGWYGSLNTIEPGMGLMYYSANSATTTFTYPDSNRDGEQKANLTSESNHWVPNIYAYPDNMTMMAVVELDDRELTSDNYELATFAANGECRGSVRLAFAEPLNRHVAFLTISGEDAAELSFRLYDTETNVEYYDAEESLDFVADAIVGAADNLYTIHFRGAAVMDEFANMVRVYPNPVNRGERVSIGMNAESKSSVRVEIVNALGAVVSEETSTQAPASIVAPITAGVYTLHITVEGKETVVRKLVVK